MKVNKSHSLSGLRIRCTSVLIVFCLWITACHSTTHINPMEIEYLSQIEPDKHSWILTTAEKGSRFYVQLQIHQSTSNIKPVEKTLQNTLISGGSGTLIHDSGYLVTAAHIAKKASNRATIRTFSGEHYQGIVIAVDHKQDLALIRYNNDPQLPPLNLSRYNTTLENEPVLAIGTPGQHPAHVSSGWLINGSKRSQISYGNSVISNPMMLSMSIEAGFSGGPVINKSGNLIGIIIGMDLIRQTNGEYRNTNNAYAIEMSAIYAFILKAVSSASN